TPTPCDGGPGGELGSGRAVQRASEGVRPKTNERLGEADSELHRHRAGRVVHDEVEQGADFPFLVHNAAGAGSEQLGISLTEALIRLRAYAFGNDRLLRDVAADVVARRLRFS